MGPRAIEEGSRGDAGAGCEALPAPQDGASQGSHLGVVASWRSGREAGRALWLQNAKSSGGLVVTGAISCGRICYNGLMKTVRVPISSDPEAQAQWEAVIKAFRAEALRRGQEAQARFDAERRRCIFAAVARGRARA